MGILSRSVFLFIVVIAYMLQECHGLTCSPQNGHNCKPSLYVTGRCLAGTCECVGTALPFKFGCVELKKPTVKVKYPSKWSNETHLYGRLDMECESEIIIPDLLTFKWFNNGGVEVGEEKRRVSLFLNSTGPQAYQCALVFNGTVSPKSDSLSFTTPNKGEPLLVKPKVTGMVGYAALHSIVVLKCVDIPAALFKYLWTIGSEELKIDSNVADINMTKDRFNKNVTCKLDFNGTAPSIESEPVSTPAVIADNIPGLEVKSFSGYLECSTKPKMAISTFDSLIYFWNSPDENVTKTSGSSLRYLTEGNSYSCSVSYNNRSLISSPEIKYTKPNTTSTLSVKEKITYQRPVEGGHISAVFDVPGHNMSSLLKKITVYEFGTPKYYIYPENVFQINNVKKKRSYLVLFYLNSKLAKRSYLSLVMMYGDIAIPDIEVDNHRTSFYQGETIPLTCKSRSDKASASYVWNGPQGEIGTAQTLRLTDIQKSASGFYTCNITIGNQTVQSDPFEIQVADSIEAPEVVSKTNTKTNSAVVHMNGFYWLLCNNKYFLKAYVAVKYVWRKNGNVINGESRSQLFGRFYNPDDGGVFTCSIQLGNVTAESQNSFNISVAFINKPEVVITPVTSSYQRYTGENLTLVCSNDNPGVELTYKWMKTNSGDDGNRVDVGNEKTLNFPDVQPQNAGRYYCEISADVLGITVKAEHSRILHVKHLDPPSLSIDKRPNSTITAGLAYTLTCHRGSPIAGIKQTIWMKGDTVLTSYDSTTIGFSKLRVSDSGNYTCSILVSTIVVKSNVLDISVTESLIAPEVKIMNPPAYFILGKEYCLHCVDKYYNFKQQDNVAYTWKKDGELLDHVYKLLCRTFNRPSDGGNFTCSITIGRVTKEAESPFSISVEYTERPDIRFSGTAPQTTLGGNYTLACLTKYAQTDTVQYMWKRDGVVVGDNTSTLNLPRIQLSDQGMYICTIKIDPYPARDSYETTISLITSFKAPVVKQTEGTQYCVLPGQSCSLTCQTQLYSSDMKYSWKKNNEPVRSDDRNFQMLNILPSDSGNYSCSITVGEVTATSENYAQILIADMVPEPEVKVVGKSPPYVFRYGTMFDLECEIDSRYSRTFVHYRWMKGNRQLSSTRKILGVIFARPEHSGIYSCTINVPNVNMSSTAYITVVDADSTSTALTTLSPTTQGSILTITCSNPSDCNRTGMDNTKCENSRCQCKEGYKMQGFTCVASGSETILPSLTLIVALVLVRFLHG